MEALLVFILLSLPAVPFYILNSRKRKRLSRIRLNDPSHEESQAFRDWQAQKMKALKWGMWGWIGAILWTIPVFLILALVGWSYASAGHKRAKRLAKALPEHLREPLQKIA